SIALLVVANTINAGADLAAVAAAVNLVWPVPILWLIVPITAAILALQMWGSYRMISNVFKWLCIALFAYIASGILARPDIGEVLRATLIPHIELNASFAVAVVAILGTTISPYLFFWQASQEVEEEIHLGRRRLWQRKGASADELKYRAWDVNAGMAIAIVVMFFIILASGAALNQARQSSSGTA